MKVGDPVRHRRWDDPRRVGRVVRVFIQRFPSGLTVPSAEVEWPRPEGNWTHAVEFLETVNSHGTP